MALHQAYVEYDDVIVNPSMEEMALAWVHSKNNTKKTQGQSNG